MHCRGAMDAAALERAERRRAQVERANREAEEQARRAKEAEEERERQILSLKAREKEASHKKATAPAEPRPSSQSSRKEPAVAERSASTSNSPSSSPLEAGRVPNGGLRPKEVQNQRQTGQGQEQQRASAAGAGRVASSARSSTGPSAPGLAEARGKGCLPLLANSTSFPEWNARCIVANEMVRVAFEKVAKCVMFVVHDLVKCCWQERERATRLQEEEVRAVILHIGCAHRSCAVELVLSSAFHLPHCEPETSRLDFGSMVFFLQLLVTVLIGVLPFPVLLMCACCR